jgi:hypothetical protein
VFLKTDPIVHEAAFAGSKRGIVGLGLDFGEDEIRRDPQAELLIGIESEANETLKTVNAAKPEQAWGCEIRSNDLRCTD